VRAGLDARAEDRDGRGVLARQQPGGEGRAGAGADRGDRRAVEHRGRLSVVGVEDGYQRLVGGQLGAGVTGKERDELARECSCRGRIPGHRRQEPVPVLHERPHTVGHGGPAGTQVGHGVRQRVDQRVHVEELLDLKPVEQQHEATLTDS
jgi:hypothetical protein